MCVQQGMQVCEEQQRSSVVLIRRLLQRCGLGRGARTSREKQRWRLWGLPSTATAYPRMPLSPSPWGMAGPQNIWENNHFHPTVATETLPFFCSGRRGKANRLGRCLFARRLGSLLRQAAKWYVTFDFVQAGCIASRKKRGENKRRALIPQRRLAKGKICFPYVRA